MGLARSWAHQRSTGAPRAASIAWKIRISARASLSRFGSRPERRFRPGEPGVSRSAMFKWDSVFEWGRRASDRAAGARRASARPAARKRHRARADRRPLPAVDRAAQRPHRRRRGAGALGRSRVRPSCCSRGPRRPGSTSACRAWSSARRCAAPRCGKGRSRASSCRSTCCPRTLSRDGYDQWLLDEIAAAGMDPSGSRSRSPKARCWSISRRSPSASARLRDAGLTIAVDDFGTGYASLAYLTTCRST